MSDSYPCSLVLAAHGSQAHQNSNQPLFDLADRIDSQRIFSKVLPAFLQGDPQMESVLDSLPIGDVIVIPVMTSQGYFSQTVVPEKLAKNVSFDQHRVLFTPELGTHGGLSELVSKRIAAMMDACSMSSHDTTVILVGHGTRQNPNSDKSTYALAAGIRERHPTVDLQVAFLDQDPTLNDVVDSITSVNRLAVPFLISRGPHGTVDVPAAFGLPTGGDIEFPLLKNSGSCITVCDIPVGMYPEIADVCVEMAADRMLAPRPIPPVASRRDTNS